MEHDRHPLAITAVDAVAANSVPPWNWRDASVNGNALVCCILEISYATFFDCFFFGIIGKVKMLVCLSASNSFCNMLMYC